MTLIKRVSICILVLILLMPTIAGCAKEGIKDSNAGTDSETSAEITYDYSHGLYVVNGYDAGHMEYIPANETISDPSTGWTYMGELYYVDPYFLGDFFRDKLTEGGASWTDDSKECIRFGFTVDDGRGGAVAGPTVEVVIDLNNNEIVGSDFTGFETQPFSDDELIKMGNELADVIRDAEKHCKDGQQ